MTAALQAEDSTECRSSDIVVNGLGRPSECTHGGWRGATLRKNLRKWNCSNKGCSSKDEEEGRLRKADGKMQVAVSITQIREAITGLRDTAFDTGTLPSRDV